MNKIMKKILGGLSVSDYLKHLFFGIIMAIFFIYMFYNLGRASFLVVLVFAVNALIYPYSRLLYESIADFIFRDNVFFVNPLFLLATKIITMLMCFGFAIFITMPAGLMYIYLYYQNKNKPFDK
jgi:hypothetical protein